MYNWESHAWATCPHTETDAETEFKVSGGLILFDGPEELLDRQSQVEQRIVETGSAMKIATTMKQENLSK